MAYLIFAPGSDEDAQPFFAVCRPDPLDEFLLEGLWKWGWRVEWVVDSCPTWRSSIEDYWDWVDLSREGVVGKDSFLWAGWREERAWRIFLGQKCKERKRLTEPPLVEVVRKRDRLSRFVKGKFRRSSYWDMGTQTGEEQCKRHWMWVEDMEEKTITEILRQIARKGDVAANETGGGEMLSYGGTSETLAAGNSRLYWHAESGEDIYVDDKGGRTYIPTRWNLPLFPWEGSATVELNKKGGQSLLESVFEAADGCQNQTRLNE